MKQYLTVDIGAYVREGIASGRLVPVSAVKYGRVLARRGENGEKLVTLTVGADGGELIESVGTVETDPLTGECGWIVTKADENGAPVIDRHGHKNQWIVSDSTFLRKYIPAEGTDGCYRPVPVCCRFVCLREDISFPFGDDVMYVDAGGYLNITDENAVYGVSEKDFYDTYRIVGEMKPMPVHDDREAR